MKLIKESTHKNCPRKDNLEQQEFAIRLGPETRPTASNARLWFTKLRQVVDEAAQPQTQKVEI